MAYPNYKSWVVSRIKSNSILGNIPIDKGLSTPCLEYAGGKLKHKYGLVSIIVNGKRKSIPAYRAMYMAVNDCFNFDSGINICHKCDNPPCVDIDHLFKGLSENNARGKRAKSCNAKKYKRHTRQRKLTNEQVIDIKSGMENPSHYCRKYNISSGYASKLINNKAKTLVEKTMVEL